MTLTPSSADGTTGQVDARSEMLLVEKTRIAARRSSLVVYRAAANAVI